MRSISRDASSTQSTLLIRRPFSVRSLKRPRTKSFIERIRSLGLLGTTGKLTRVAAALALVLMAGVLGTLQFGGAAAQEGLVLVLVGAVVAFVGGVLGRFSGA